MSLSIRELQQVLCHLCGQRQGRSYWKELNPSPEYLLLKYLVKEQSPNLFIRKQTSFPLLSANTDFVNVGHAHPGSSVCSAHRRQGFTAEGG